MPLTDAELNAYASLPATREDAAGPWVELKVDERDRLVGELRAERTRTETAENLTEEWTVVNDLGLRMPLGPPFTSLHAAEEYLMWLMRERREEMRRAAAENEASGFKGGNEAYYRWNNPRDGEKDRTYRILARKVTPWAVLAASVEEPA